MQNKSLAQTLLPGPDPFPVSFLSAMPPLRSWACSDLCTVYHLVYTRRQCPEAAGRLLHQSFPLHQ